MSDLEDEKVPEPRPSAEDSGERNPDEARPPEGAVPEIGIPESAVEVPPMAGMLPADDVRGTTADRPSVPPAKAHRPTTGTIFFARLVQAVWLGSAVFLGFAALAVFRMVGPVSGADAVGAMLTRWHYIALLAPAILIVVEWRRMRSRMVMLLFVAVILAMVQGFTDLRIRRIRASSPVPISSLDENDPVRRRFGALHGLSSILLLAQIVVGISVIAAEPDPE